MTRSKEIYRGYTIEVNSYGKGEYTIFHQGDELWFTDLTEAKEFIDSLTGTGNNIQTFVDMTKIKDSLQLDSGTVVAKETFGEYVLSIEVQGDVRVRFGDEWYRYPSEFPAELKNIIEDDELYYINDRVYIAYNNWFELFVYDKDGSIVSSDLVDPELLSSDKLHELMADYYDCVMSEVKK